MQHRFVRQSRACLLQGASYVTKAVHEVTRMTMTYVAIGIAIAVVAVLGFAIGPDIYRYLRIRSM